MRGRAVRRGVVGVMSVVVFAGFWCWQGEWNEARGQVPRVARRAGLMGRAADAVLFRPPPSMVYGVETPASRMARYAQLSGRMPDESSGPSSGYIVAGASAFPGQSVGILPGAPPDPALRWDARSRVVQRYERWRARRGW